MKILIAMLAATLSVTGANAAVGRTAPKADVREDVYVTVDFYDEILAVYTNGMTRADVRALVRKYADIGVKGLVWRVASLGVAGHRSKLMSSPSWSHGNTNFQAFARTGNPSLEEYRDQRRWPDAKTTATWEKTLATIDPYAEAVAACHEAGMELLLWVDLYDERCGRWLYEHPDMQVKTPAGATYPGLRDYARPDAVREKLDEIAELYRYGADGFYLSSSCHSRHLDFPEPDEAFGRLPGDKLTGFLRQLRKESSPHKLKLVMGVPFGDTLDFCSPHFSAHPRYRIEQQWKRWIDEKLVDAMVLGDYQENWTFVDLWKLKGVDMSKHDVPPFDQLAGAYRDYAKGRVKLYVFPGWYEVNTLGSQIAGNRAASRRMKLDGFFAHESCTIEMAPDGFDILRRELHRPERFELHVSPKAADGGDGSLEKPFNALWPAQEAARYVHKAHPDRVVTIYLHAGEYRPEESYVFDRNDRNLTIKAFGDDRVVITGARKITGFRPAAGRKGVFVADARACGYRGFERPLASGTFESSKTANGVRRENGFYVDGRAMTLARHPNAGYLPMTELVNPRLHQFRMDLPKGADLSLKAAPDLFANGYFKFLWDHEIAPVSVSDDGVLTLDWNYDHEYDHTIAPGMPVTLQNALALLDAPGEWYLDRAEGLVYFMPPEGVDLAKAECLMSEAAFPFVRFVATEGIRFENVVFEYGRSDALYFQEAKRCGLSGCVIRRFGGQGVTIKDCTDCEIAGSILREFGFGGMNISGGDRPSLTPCRVRVADCEIDHVGQIMKTYTAAIQVNGCGVEIVNSHFHDIPSSALCIYGNDHLVESNLFERVVTESDDQGATDTYGDPTYGGIVFRHNVFQDISSKGMGDFNVGGHSEHMAAGIRFDDCVSGMIVEGNRFDHCSGGYFGSVQIHMGRYNLVTNNLMIGGNGGVSISVWPEGRWEYCVTGDRSRYQPGWSPFNFKDMKYFSGIDVNRDPWASRFPWLKDLLHTVCTNTIVCNVMVGMKDGIQIMRRTEDTGDIANVSFKELPDDATLAKVPGFTIPPTAAEVGPKSAAYRRARKNGAK